MEFARTRDHDTIRRWIETSGGRPVELLLGGGREGLITLDFGRLLLEDYRAVSWEEFFAWFDTSRIAFRYRPDPQQGYEERSYNFISGKNVFEPHENETEFAKENEVAQEMHRAKIATGKFRRLST